MTDYTKLFTPSWAYGIATLAVITWSGHWLAQRINHGLTLWRDRRATLRAAVLTFESAFVPEISALTHGEATMNTLSDSLLTHRAAVDTVLPILSKIDSRRLQTAWAEYCGQNDGFHKSEAEVVVLGYSHPDLYQTGLQRFNALHSCLHHLTT